MTKRILILALAALIPSTALAQESKLSADFRREGKELRQACEKGFKSIGSCGHGLITQQPLHLAIGSLAPGNGFALGVSFAERWTPNEAWRITWSADGVRSFPGAWRGGFYMKLVHTPATSGVVVASPGAPAGATSIGARDISVIDVYLQTLSLRRVGFFGTGPESVEADKTFFGQKQTQYGASLLYPLTRVPGLGALRPSAILGVTGRHVDLRAAPGEKSPSIEALFNDLTAPGIADHRRFIELREAIRLRPSVANDGLRFNYLVSAQQFRSGGDVASFDRWTIDLGHEIPIYRRVSSTGPKDFNGPNECGSSTGSMSCPQPTWSRNLYGSVNIRALVSTSNVSGTNRVPFYFQQTLGGADVNGEHFLSSFADYRFRGPHLIAFQESLEHSIWGPFGAFVMLEHGKVAFRRSDLDFHRLASSTTAGITIRAGGVPMIRLAYSHGREGGHAAFSMSASLLGGGARPSLY